MIISSVRSHCPPPHSKNIVLSLKGIILRPLVVITFVVLLPIKCRFAFKTHDNVLLSFSEPLKCRSLLPSNELLAVPLLQSMSLQKAFSSIVTEEKPPGKELASKNTLSFISGTQLQVALPLDRDQCEPSYQFPELPI